MTSALVNSCYSIVVDEKIKANPAKYVESVKTSDEKEEISKWLRPVLVDVQICSVHFLHHPLAIDKIFHHSWLASAYNKVCPLPSLAA